MASMSVCSLFVVLPAYNEAENLPALVDDLEVVLSGMSSSGYGRKYIVVDDGSSDETPDLLLEYQLRLPMEVVTHTINQGLGVTIRDGLRRASELAGGEDVIVTMDADNTHPTELIPLMAREIRDGADVVVASRYRPGARVHGLAWHRRLLSLIAAALFKVVFPIRGVRDYTCGFRAYRAAVIRRGFDTYGDAFVDQQGFQATADILLRLARLEVSVMELPMVLRYDLKGGASKMRVGSTVLATLRLMLRRRIESFSPLPESAANGRDRGEAASGGTHTTSG